MGGKEDEEGTEGTEGGDVLQGREPCGCFRRLFHCFFFLLDFVP